jgi:hypothetical protein
LILEPAHVGIEGFCPDCNVPIIARPNFSGKVQVDRLDQVPAQPSLPPPPLPSPGGTMLQTRSGVFVESRNLERRASPFLIVAVVSALVLTTLAAAAISLRRSGHLFDFAVPSRVIPVPVPIAQTPMTPAAPAKTTTQAVAVEPDAPALPKPDDPQKALLSEATQKTLRAFLSAERSWEKLMHVLEPEEDLLSIVDFQKLDAIAKEAPVRSLEILYVDVEKRWISLASVPGNDGILNNFCFVHRNQDGTAKIDFSLYWQNRSDLIRPFLEGGPNPNPLLLRAEMRRLPPSEAKPGLRLALAQAYSSYAPVEISVPESSPLASEISARPGIDSPSPVILELVWNGSAPTVGKIVRWGLWAPEP